MRAAGPGATRQPPGEATRWLRGADVAGSEQGADPHRHHLHNGSSGGGIGRGTAPGDAGTSSAGHRGVLALRSPRELPAVGHRRRAPPTPPGAPRPPCPRCRGRPLAASPRGHALQPPLSPGLPPRARRGAAPGAVPRLASRHSSARAPKSGNYANTRDALPFDLNFLGMIPSHYAA